MQFSSVLLQHENCKRSKKTGSICVVFKKYCSKNVAKYCAKIAFLVYFLLVFFRTSLAWSLIILYTGINGELN